MNVRPSYAARAFAVVPSIRAVFCRVCQTQFRAEGSMTFACRKAVFVASLTVALGGAAVAGSDPQALELGQSFGDCSGCPEIVVVPAGRFTTGSSAAATTRAYKLISPRLLVADSSGLGEKTDLPPPPPPVSTPPAPAREADKAAYFQHVAPLFRPTDQPSETPFCTGFLRDLAAMRGVRFVEPIWRAASYDDPKFQSFRHACHDPDLRKVVNTNPGWQFAKEGDRASDSDGSPGIAYYFSGNFAIYDIDLFNGTEPELVGNSWVLYGEGLCRRYEPHDCLGSEYNLIRSHDQLLNGKACDRFLIGQEEGPYDYSGPRAVKIGENAIIKYKGLNLILSVSLSPQMKGPPIGRMTLSDANPLAQPYLHKKKIGTECSYWPIDENRNWEKVK